MKKLIFTSTLLFAFPLLAAKTSQKAVVTCDFRPVAEEKTGYAALGKLEFKIDLEKKKVPVKCLSKECVLDGEEGAIELSAILTKEKEERVFSEESSPTLILYGSNGDDTRFMVFLNYDNDATLTLMVTDNLTQSTKPVKCDVQLK